jgi:hypothetical protein
VTVPQIATSTGHSPENVAAIFDAHYLGRKRATQMRAGLKLEQRTKL